MSYRPGGWPKCPCDECESKNEDEYGLFCDLACGKHTAWLNREDGADAMLEALKAKGLEFGQTNRSYALAIRMVDGLWERNRKGRLVFLNDDTSATGAR